LDLVSLIFRESPTSSKEAIKSAYSDIDTWTEYANVSAITSVVPVSIFFLDTSRLHCKEWI